MSAQSPPSPVATPPREPTPEFIDRVTLAVRGGASPYVAAEWCGVSRAVFKRWLRQHAELKAAVRLATAHLKVRLQADLAKRSPEKALRRLDAREEQAEAGRSSAPRPYSRSGSTIVQRALPFLVERVADPSIPMSDLSPIEAGARAWLDDVLNDLGGRERVPATKMALLRTCLGSVIIQSSLDAYIFTMASADGLVSRKHRRVFPVVESRMRIADSLTRQLQALGLEKAKAQPTDLQRYLEKTYGSTHAEETNADAAAHEQENGDAPHE